MGRPCNTVRLLRTGRRQSGYSMRLIVSFLCMLVFLGSDVSCRALAATAPSAKTSQQKKTAQTSRASAPKAAVKPSSSAGPASAKPNTASKPARAQSSGAAKAASGNPGGKSGSSLSSLQAQFDALVQDPQRGALRESWLTLEGKFKALAAKSRGETEARAAFYQARTREELGRRSYNPGDHLQAVELYGEVARIHTRYSVAPESLYRQAAVLAYRLNDAAGARASAELLVKSYPKYAIADEGRKLLQELDAASPGASRAEAGADTGKMAAAQDSAAAKGEKASPSSVTLKNIRWQGKSDRATITLELDTKPRYAYEFVPPDSDANTPARLYLDIPGALPAASIKPGLAPKGLIVTRIRTDQAGDGTRIMFDCDGLQCYAVNSPSSAPHTIRIEVSRKADIKGGIKVLRGEKQGAGKAAAEDPERTGGTGRQALSGKGAGSKPPGSLMEQLGLTVQTIMLDAGHGGKDPGTMHNGIVERDFTLSMTKRVGTLLQKKGFTVLYTRTSNRFISLQDRPDIANRKKADLFISVHANANPDPAVRGLEVYYLDMAKTTDAAKVAARENAVSVKNISDLQFILTDLMLSAKLEESRDLAHCVRDGMLKELRQAKLPAHENGVRSAPFYVLMGARMPAVLVEFGYVTHKEEAANLCSEKFLQRQAEGLVDGIVAYKVKLAKFAPQ